MSTSSEDRMQYLRPIERKLRQLCDRSEFRKHQNAEAITAVLDDIHQSLVSHVRKFPLKDEQDTTITRLFLTLLAASRVSGVDKDPAWEIWHPTSDRQWDKSCVPFVNEKEFVLVSPPSLTQPESKSFEDVVTPLITPPEQGIKRSNSAVDQDDDTPPFKKSKRESVALSVAESDILEEQENKMDVSGGASTNGTEDESFGGADRPQEAAISVSITPEPTKKVKIIIPTRITTRSKDGSETPSLCKPTCEAIDAPTYKCSVCITGTSKRPCIFQGWGNRCLPCAGSNKGGCSYAISLEKQEVQRESLYSFVTEGTQHLRLCAKRLQDIYQVLQHCTSQKAKGLAKKLYESELERFDRIILEVVRTRGPEGIADDLFTSAKDRDTSIADARAREDARRKRGDS